MQVNFAYNIMCNWRRIDFNTCSATFYKIACEYSCLSLLLATKGHFTGKTATV